MANEDKFAKTIDDEELDEVAGGTADEIVKDFKFMVDLGVADVSQAKQRLAALKKNDANYGRAYGSSSFFANDNLWHSVGIDANYSDRKNTYKKGGEFISRNDALIYAMRQQNKYLNLENYI